MKNILQEAEDIVGGERLKTYGPPRESFERIAALWSAYVNTPITPVDVAHLMILLKVSRNKKHKRDNLVDIAGYALLADMLASKEAPAEEAPAEEAPAEEAPAKEAPPAPPEKTPDPLGGSYKKVGYWNGRHVSTYCFPGCLPRRLRLPHSELGLEDSPGPGWGVLALTAPEAYPRTSLCWQYLLSPIEVLAAKGGVLGVCGSPAPEESMYDQSPRVHHPEMFLQKWWGEAPEGVDVQVSVRGGTVSMVGRSEATTYHKKLTDQELGWLIGGRVTVLITVTGKICFCEDTKKTQTSAKTPSNIVGTWKGRNVVYDRAGGCLSVARNRLEGAPGTSWAPSYRRTCWLLPLTDLQTLAGMSEGGLRVVEHVGRPPVIETAERFSVLWKSDPLTGERIHVIVRGNRVRLAFSLGVFSFLHYFDRQLDEEELGRLVAGKLEISVVDKVIQVSEVSK